MTIHPWVLDWTGRRSWKCASIIGLQAVDWSQDCSSSNMKYAGAINPRPTRTGLGWLSRDACTYHPHAIHGVDCLQQVAGTAPVCLHCAETREGTRGDNLRGVYLGMAWESVAARWPAGDLELRKTAVTAS